MRIERALLSVTDKTGLVEFARYRVPTSLDLETRTECETVVWRLLPT